MEWNQVKSIKRFENKGFNIWDFRKLGKKEQIEYILKNQVPETIKIKIDDEVDVEYYGDYNVIYADVPTWQEISRSWNLGIGFIFQFIQELDLKTLMYNDHLKLSDYNKLKIYKSKNINLKDFFKEFDFDADTLTKAMQKDKFFSQQEKDYIESKCVARKIKGDDIVQAEQDTYILDLLNNGYNAL